MPRSPTRPLGDAAAILARVLCAARATDAVVAFDLDSTLLDNRPRNARIFRELGAELDIPALRTAQPHHFADWNLERSLIACGVDATRAAAVLPRVRELWLARFFTSEYCVEDVAIPGAPAFVHAVRSASAVVCYLTGRDEGMRAGTLTAFAREGFPAPDARRIHLLMKPRADLHDDDFKRQAHGDLPRLGRLVAAFDNEPTHVNDYARTFPEALVVHVATDQSERPVEVLAGIPSILDFTAAALTAPPPAGGR